MIPLPQPPECRNYRIPFLAFGSLLETESHIVQAGLELTLNA